MFGPDEDQVVVLLDDDDKGNPIVRYYFQPPGLGVCSVGIAFSHNDWEQAEHFLKSITEEQAREVTNKAMDAVMGLPEEADDEY
jgi:hypothetical protein